MYHGADGAWTATRRVEELFDLPDEEKAREQWLGWMPRFEYLLDDLTTEREEALRARTEIPQVQLAFLLLRYGRDAQLAQRLPRWVGLFAEVSEGPDGDGALRVAALYLTEVGDKAAGEAMRGVLRSALGSQRAEEVMKTLGEELREEGRQLGWEQGLAKGLAEGQAKGLAEGQGQGARGGTGQGARGGSPAGSQRSRCGCQRSHPAAHRWVHRREAP